MYQHEVVEDNLRNITLHTSSDSNEFSRTIKPVPKFSSTIQNQIKELDDLSISSDGLIINKPISYDIYDNYLNLHFFTAKERKVIIQTNQEIRSFNISASFVKIYLDDLCYYSKYLNLVIYTKNNHERINHLYCPNVNQSQLVYVLDYIHWMFPHIFITSLLYWTFKYIKYRREKDRIETIHHILELHDQEHDDSFMKNEKFIEKEVKKKKLSIEISYSFIVIYLALLFIFLSFDLSYATTCDPYTVFSNQMIPTINRDDRHSNETVELLGSYSLRLLENSRSICLSLSPDNTTDPIHLVLQFTNELFTRSEWLYDSCFHEGIGASKQQCFGNGGCGSGKCGGIKTSDQDAKGELSAFEASKYFGYSFCDDPYTNFEMGCGGVHLTDKGCLYHKYAFKPVSASFEAFEIYSTESRYKVVATIDSKKLTVGINDPTKDINVIISGSSIPPDLSLNGKTFVHYNGAYYMGPVAKRNSPVAGMVGDFQCNKQDFINKKWENCAIAPGLLANKKIKRNGKHATVSYDFVPCGATKIKTFATSPITHGKNVWTVSENGVWGTVAETHEPLDVFLEIRKPLKISRLIKKAEPVVKFIRNLESCRSCLNESSFEVEMKSTTNNGRVYVSSKDSKIQVLTQAFDITGENKNYIVRYSTQEKTVDTDFIFNEKTIVHVKNDLKLPVFKFLANLLSDFTTEETDDKDNTGLPTPKDPFCIPCLFTDFFKKIFSFFLNFWSKILGIDVKKWLIIISVCFVGAVIIFAIVRRAFLKLIIKKII